MKPQRTFCQLEVKDYRAAGGSCTRRGRAEKPEPAYPTLRAHYLASPLATIAPPIIEFKTRSRAELNRSGRVVMERDALGVTCALIEDLSDHVWMVGLLQRPMRRCQNAIS